MLRSENAGKTCDLVADGVGFNSDWLRKWREFFQPVTKQNFCHVMGLLCAGQKLDTFDPGCLRISRKGLAGYLTPISHFIHQNPITNAVRFFKRIRSLIVNKFLFVLYFNWRADAIRLAADVTRLALEMLFVLTVGPKAQLALCEEVPLPNGEQQKGMR